MVLLDVLKSKVKMEPRRGVYGGGDEMLGAETSESDNWLKGLDYLGMLNVARQFAHNGEGM